MTTPATLTIPGRYNGPPESGNGGFVAGRMAEELLGALGRPSAGPGCPWVEVTLRRPPPLDTPYELALTDETLRAHVADTLVAEALLAADPSTAGTPLAVPPVGRDDALAAEQRYEGLTRHPFPTCWVCGTDRPDGYHLQPGAVGGGHRTACLWRVSPEASPSGQGPVPASALWAALDCPGGWTALVEGRVAVLGRMTARVASVPSLGEQCLVMGRLLGTEGRKTWTATTVYAADGSVHAMGRATWIAIDLP